MTTNTMVALKTYTFPSAASSYTFTSVPQGYTDLVIVVGGSINANDLPAIQIGNGTVATSGYSQTIVRGNGSAAGSYRFTGYSTLWGGDVANSANSQIVWKVNLQSYSNTNTYKTLLSRYDNSTGDTGATVHLWQSTSAIDTIKIGTLGGNSWNTGTTITIYGI